jgi:Amt family ammonium transporter
MFLFFKLMSLTIGVRVSPEEETQGLDVFEHGNEAYAPDQYAAAASGLPSSSRGEARRPSPARI